MWKPREISTPQLLIGVAALFAALLVCTRLLNEDGAAVEAAIISPDDGAELSVGPIAMEFRATVDRGGSGTLQWELSLRPTPKSDSWMQIAKGSSFATPRNRDSLKSITLSEPGDYQLRLIVQRLVSSSVMWSRSPSCSS